MEEMMEETLDSVDDEEIEEEADAEVDKVLYELTDGKLGQAGAVGAALPVSRVRSIHKRTADSAGWAVQAEEEEENEEEIQRMRKEMQELLSS